MKRNVFTSHSGIKCVTHAVVLASFAILGTANATSEPDYRPAYLTDGHCGSGSIKISVDGKGEQVHCANLDTHTGRGYYEREHCYKVEHKPYHGHWNWNGHGKNDSYGKGYHRGYYKHCENKKYHYQLPVIEIEKRAYDKYHKMIATSHSKPYLFDVWTNGGYGKNFELKSKQKKYLIVKKDHYTIYENAPYYKTRIECGGDPVHGYEVTVGISKPGQKVSCVFHNYKPHYYHKPYYDPKPAHKPKPAYHKPKPDYRKPQACTAWGRNLDKAKHAYYGKCHVKLLDCDPMNGGYMCSSQQIGAYAPAWRQ